MCNDYKLIKQSLLEWYPINKDDEVLLINGSGSALDELFDERGILTRVESDDEMRVLIDKEKKYDLILIYDMYNFCLKCRLGVEKTIRTSLLLKKDQGVLLLAMENKLGMKYWSGCQEEQYGGFYKGIEDYSGWNSNITPLSKRELEVILDGIASIHYQFYYPYPDYKYPTMIFTDECLPKVGELFRNIRNIDRDRYVMFDERRAFDSVIKAGLFPEFSNSYLVKVM